MQGQYHATYSDIPHIHCYLTDTILQYLVIILLPGFCGEHSWVVADIQCSFVVYRASHPADLVTLHCII